MCVLIAHFTDEEKDGRGGMERNLPKSSQGPRAIPLPPSVPPPTQWDIH